MAGNEGIQIGQGESDFLAFLAPAGEDIGYFALADVLAQELLSHAKMGGCLIEAQQSRVYGDRDDNHAASASSQSNLARAASRRF